MNLVDDPWIPVAFREGGTGRVTLRQVFSQGREIADLAARPHERIALMRLLVCVAQAALDGPDDNDGWEEAADRLPAAAEEYLARWRPRFELFGDGPRFLQARTEPMGWFEASKLLFDRACGNNPTVFDHQGGSPRRLEPQEMALALLYFQNFSASIGAGYTGKAPCLDRHFLQSWLIGDCLLDTVLANGVSFEVIARTYSAGGLGRPTWELEIDFDNQAFRTNTTLSYLGRLSPVTRRVWLHEDGTGFDMGKAGLSHPPYEEYRESVATIQVFRKKDSEEFKLLRGDASRRPWRDLETVVSGQQNGAFRPLPLQREEPAAFRRLWLGALLTDGKAKYEDTVEAAYAIPLALLEDPDRQLDYQGGVDHAAKWSKRLGFAVQAYAEFNMPGDRSRAERHYWNALDQKLPWLMSPVDDRAVSEEGDTPWMRSVREAAAAAYRHACPQETPRQMEAFAAGLKKLRNVKPKQEKS